MAKALKPLVIVLLLLSIASLTLGILLFNKREILKGRTQKLEQTVLGVASSLNAGKEPFIQDLGVSLNNENLKTYPNMDTELGQFQKLASVRYEELDTTYGDLKRTSDELTVTKDELAATRAELDQAKQTIVALNETIVQKDSEIAQANSTIDSLNGQITGLNSQITDLTAQIAKVEEEKRDLNDKIAEMDQDTKNLEADLANCRGGDIDVRMKKGLSGKIVVVNKDWNFVVIDVGFSEGAQINGTFLVHRGEKLIGKVRVSSVTPSLALAEIVNDWQTTPFREGDHIVY